MAEREEDAESSRAPTFVLRAGGVAGPALDWVAFAAALERREGLAVAAKALAVLIPFAVSRFAGRQHR